MKGEHVRIPVDSIGFGPDLAQMKRDERLMALMDQALAGNLSVYYGAVPIGQLVPFDPDYRPDLQPVCAKAIQTVIENWTRGQFTNLLVYQRGVWFVVSDDYIPLFAILRGRPDYVPCWILGKPENDQVKDVQGPIDQADVRKILGLP